MSGPIARAVRLLPIQPRAGMESRQHYRRPPINIAVHDVLDNFFDDHMFGAGAGENDRGRW